MTGTEFRRARTAAGLSHRKAAETLGVSLSTIQRWEADDAPIPSAAAEQIASLAAKQAGDPSVTAYILGRLYAVIESVLGLHEAAYRSASQQPGIAYGPLLAKLAGSGDVAAEVDQLVGQIAAFPRLLNMPEQGAWALGYYHRRAGKPWPAVAEGEAAD